MTSRGVSRRQFLRTSAGAAGVAGILASGRAPATAQTRELSFLTVASFVPDTDKELKRQFDEWGAKNKVKVRLDIIAHLQPVTTTASAAPARSAHHPTAPAPGPAPPPPHSPYPADPNHPATPPPPTTA